MTLFHALLTNTYVEAIVHVKWQSSDYCIYIMIMLCCVVTLTSLKHRDYYQNGLDYSFIHAVKYAGSFSKQDENIIKIGNQKNVTGQKDC